MVKFALKKLVRDKIVDKQLASGAKPLYWQLSEDEHAQHLVQKVVEEIQEVTTATKDELASELADVQQALDDLRDKLGVSKLAVEQAQAAKNAQNGSFEKGIYIEHVEFPEGDKWIDYYRQKSDLYPEIK